MIEPIKSISGELEITVCHDPFPIPKSFVVGDDHPVSIFYSKRRWWKPWTWFQKDIKIKVPYGTVVNLEIVEEEKEKDNGVV